MKQESKNTHAAILTGGLKSIFRSLKYKNYRLFFAGQSLSLIGTWIQRIAIPWLVYRLTGSAFLLGLVGFANQIPTFLVSPFAGVLSDRYNRYHVLIITQILAMIQALTLAFLFFTGMIAVWHLIVLGAFLGCINAFEMPTRQSFIVNLIDGKEDLGNAIALNSTMVNGARLFGPSIAGILIAAAGEGFCFLFNGLSFIFVIISLLMMKVTLVNGKARSSHVLQELREGVSYTFGFAPIRSIILLLGLISIMGMPYVVLMPVITKDILHGSSHTFGFLMAASGTGALIAALYFASRKSVLGLGKVIAFSAVAFGSGLVLLSLSRFFLLSFIVMLVTGWGMMMQMASSNTIIQTLVDDDKRGRVMSFYIMAFVGSAPFGSLLAGFLASTIGAPNTLMIGGAACIVGAAVFARKLPQLKKMVYPIYVRMGIIPEVASGIQAATELTVPSEE